MSQGNNDLGRHSVQYIDPSDFDTAYALGHWTPWLREIIEFKIYKRRMRPIVPPRQITTNLCNYATIVSA